MGKVSQIDGHSMEVLPTESGRRWRLVCSCGYGKARWVGDRPSTRATEREAIRQGIWHLQQVDKGRADREQNGLVVDHPLYRHTA